MAWRRSKYRAVPTVVDGIRFASKAEAAKYGELKLRELAGEIRNLVLQPRYEFVLNNWKVGTYVGDFEFEEKQADGWKLVTLDVKGMRTPVYKLKAKLFRALVGREIVETK